MLLTLGQKKAAILTNRDLENTKVIRKTLEWIHSRIVIGIGSDRACVVAVNILANSA